MNHRQGASLLLCLGLLSCQNAGSSSDLQRPADRAALDLGRADRAAKPGLTEVKVATLYERVSDGIAFGRSLAQLASIFQETRADLILRSFFRWQPVPESATATLPGYPPSYVSEKAAAGYTYAQYREALEEIRKVRPKILVIGALAAQRVNTVEVNDLTLEGLTQPQTWAMALDPNTFGLGAMFTAPAKEHLQCTMAVTLHWINQVSCPAGYDPTKATAYFPDITNAQYQDLLLSQAKRQIDLGVDGIWIDMLFAQASGLAAITKSSDHAGVKQSYQAASKLVDDIRAYGLTRYQRPIYVGTWSTFADLPFPYPKVDFVTVSPTATEVSSGLVEADWRAIKAKLGDLPVLAFIDWNGTDQAPLGVFSKLSVDGQRAFLKQADGFFAQQGVVFAYPVHGGTFGAARCFGHNVYDSQATDCLTYPTIRELAGQK